MIIQSDSVQMKSASSYAATSQVATKVSTKSVLMTAAGGQLFANTNLGKNKDNRGSAEDIQNRFRQAQSVRGAQNKDSSTKSLAQIQQETLDYLMLLFFGKSPKNVGSFWNARNMSQGLMTQTVETESLYYEEESFSFSTTGTVITADGRRLSFNVEASMSRSFMEYSYSRTQMLTTAEFCDPLVINLNSNVADVTDQKFYFDLDADGHEEFISQLGSGSGFLALDKNGDGKINDGSELFGAKSGDGFADLAKYESDGNGWIDEADEIFDKLLIWTKDSSGKDVLIGLGKAGIGAIYLGNVNTGYSMTEGASNAVNARIRKTGIFLYENGMAGTIQHVDFAK